MNKYKIAFRIVLIGLGILSGWVVITSLLSPNIIINIMGMWILFANGYLVRIGWIVTSFIEDIKEDQGPTDERICAHTGEW